LANFGQLWQALAGLDQPTNQFHQPWLAVTDLGHLWPSLTSLSQLWCTLTDFEQQFDLVLTNFCQLWPTMTNLGQF
jgi:hypothetical protein